MSVQIAQDEVENEGQKLFSYRKRMVRVHTLSKAAAGWQSAPCAIAQGSAKCAQHDGPAGLGGSAWRSMHIAAVVFKNTSSTQLHFGIFVPLGWELILGLFPTLGPKGPMSPAASPENRKGRSSVLFRFRGDLVYAKTSFLACGCRAEETFGVRQCLGAPRPALFQTWFLAIFRRGGFCTLFALLRPPFGASARLSACDRVYSNHAWGFQRCGRKNTWLIQKLYCMCGQHVAYSSLLMPWIFMHASLAWEGVTFICWGMIYICRTSKDNYK